MNHGRWIHALLSKLGATMFLKIFKESINIFNESTCVLEGSIGTCNDYLA